MLVLTPQLVELEALRAGFEQRGHEFQNAQAGRMEVWSIPRLGLTLAVAGHGKTQFGVQSQYLLDQLADAEGVICTGGSGALDPALEVGDTVIGTVTVEHDYHIRFVEAELPVHPGYGPYLTALRNLVEGGEFNGRVCFDRIASGDEDVIEPARAAQLRDETEAACVAWEGSGGARAAAFNEVPFVEIRGITDTADESAHGDYHENLQVVMPRIADLLVRWRAGNTHAR